MAQQLRPSSTQVNNGWSSSSGGAGPWVDIDEITPSDADYAFSPTNPVLAALAVFVQTGIDPGVNTGHVLHIRYHKNASAGKTINGTLEVRQGGGGGGGGTLIYTIARNNWSHIATQEAIPIPEANIALITDYAQLRIDVVATSTGGGSGRHARVTWAYIEIPDATPGITELILTSDVETAYADYPPSIEVGFVGINLPTIATAEALYAPTLVSFIPAETGAFYIGQSRLRAGTTLKGGEGIWFISPPLLASGEAIHAPTVTALGAPTLTLPTIATEEVLFAPTLTQVITPPAVASAEALYTPTLTLAGVTLSLPAIASEEALYPPSLGLGAVSLGLPTVASAEALYTPTLGLAAYALELPAVASEEALYAPTVAPAGLGLSLPTIATGEAIYTPTLDVGGVGLELAYLSSGEVLYTPSLEQLVALATITSELALYPPALTQIIAIPAVASAEALYAPTVQASAAQLTLPALASALVLYLPTIAYVTIARTVGSEAASIATHHEAGSQPNSHEHDAVVTVGREASFRTN